MMDGILSIIQAMQNEEESLLKTRSETVDSDSSRAKMMILGGTLTAFLLAAGVGFLLTQHIAAPLQGLTEVARQITRGNLNVRVAATERNDEVGALAQAFEKMAPIAAGNGDGSGAELRAGNCAPR
ncbi:MAG: HAMP domain-containing protein [Chthoniobacteraceae bacterium]